MIAGSSGGPPVLLETGPREQFKRLALEGCLGAVFYRRSDGCAIPARCDAWSCPECGPRRARAVRAGIYRACRELGLSDMLTLTLPPGARGSTALESRTAMSRLRNAFLTWLRKRGFLGDYVGVPEAHQDGTCHSHDAMNLEPMVAAYGSDYSAVQAALHEAWSRLGGGWIWWKRGTARRGRPAAQQAAAYLSKYLGKMQGKRTPWDEYRWCTKDDSFRLRPWRHVWSSRRAGKVIASRFPRPEPELTFGLAIERGPDGHFRNLLGTWELRKEWEFGRLAPRVSGGGVRFDPWNPALGSAITDGCDGHDVNDEWAPGACHHAFRDGALACWCVPPWASEPPWAAPPRLLSDLESWDEREALHAPTCTCDEHLPSDLREATGRWSRWGAG